MTPNILVIAIAIINNNNTINYFALTEKYKENVAS
jgi:hypothetical protein